MHLQHFFTDTPYLALLAIGTAGVLVGGVFILMVCRWRCRQRLATETRVAGLEKRGLEMRLDELRQRLESTLADRDLLASQHLRAEKQNAELNARLEAERQLAQEKMVLLNDARERLTAEFSVLADSILEAKGRSFTEQSKNQMVGLLGPLQQQLGEFRQRVEDVYDRESRDRATLLNEIGHLKNLNERIGRDALNLTNALKGDVKTLGNWGEVVLARILEASGLEKGRGYDTQVRLTDPSGTRFQPDVIVRLPEGRDIVVDAKVSLKAYERYHNAGDDTAERDGALRAHMASLRAHIKGLSEKHYETLVGIHSLDFVIMFVPVEAAFLTALENDRTLFGDAFEKNVILVSPSTLLVTLRTVHHMWRFVDQNANAMEIARQAGGLYDKFVGFIESLEDVGRQLDRARTAYRTARERLSSGRGNLVRRAEQLRALGVKTHKILPADYAVGDVPEKDQHQNEERGDTHVQETN